MTRYKPGGTYWANKYKQDYPGKTAVPIQSWQIWNEPNLKKYFTPGSTTLAAAQKYAQLLALADAAIAARDAQAKVVLAGMPSVPDANGSSNAWDFLDALYTVAGVKADFDVAALHPYGCNLDQTRTGIARFSASMKNHADGLTPLWLTEFAWGSGEPDQFCKNKGLTGQRDLLVSSFNLILQNRKNWNVQRLFWFLWRDAEPGSIFAGYCSICGSAGLLRYDRTPKPAYTSFRSYTAETTPPVARIISGPSQGSVSNDSTPTFTFGSNEAGSTFACRFDAAAFKPCASPLILGAPLSHGAHTFYVKAIDAPGNESAVVSSSFTVDIRAPVAPSITDTDPNSPSNVNTPEGEGHRRGGLHREALQDRGLHRRPGGLGLRRPVRDARPGGLGRRQHDHPLPRHRPGCGRQHLALLGRPRLRRGLGGAADDDHRRAGGLHHRQHPHLQLLLQRGGLDLPVSLRLRSVRPLLGAGRQPHPVVPARPRLPHLRGPGHRQGAEHRSDARYAHLHDRPLKAESIRRA